MRSLLVLAATIAVAAPFPVIAEDDPARCAQLRRQLEIIDAQARKRSTPALTERRRLLAEEAATLKCVEAGSNEAASGEAASAEAGSK